MMNLTMKKQKLLIIVAIVAIVAVLAINIIAPMVLDIGGYGPTKTVTNATVVSKHVDISKGENSSETHYMVTTSEGTFEVDNGILLKVWNADEIYGKLKEGKTYNLTTKGEKHVNWFFQYYPYVTAATEVLTK